MIINSITLKNFKSYEDETTINLRPNNKQNIVLIGGENGAGKSTLFEAIKICIYGATAYGYVGQNYFYIEKVKSMICSNAFTKDDIESFVTLELSFAQGSEEVIYTLHRKWNYQNQKINETFSVFQGEKELKDDEFHYFEEFLKAELPPSMLNFFFFDGEELNSMFTINGSSQLKNAVLQLLNYNSFELLRKQLNNYQRNSQKHDELLKAAQENYDTCFKEFNDAQAKITELKEQIKKYEIELANKNVEKDSIEETFRKNGGILEDERNELIEQIASLENERADISAGIRTFCNDSLPFLLLEKQFEQLTSQIKNEENKNSYTSFKDKLTSEVIKNAMPSNNSVSTEVANDISTNILHQLFDVKKIQSTHEILGLSKEQMHFIYMTYNNTFSDRYNVLKEYEKLNTTTQNLDILRNKLRTSVSGDFLNKYLSDIHKVNDEINEIKLGMENAIINLSLLEENLPSLSRNLAMSKNETIALLRESNINDISRKLTAFLDELLTSLTESKIASIEKEFISIFSKIIRKNNFIDALKLDKDFHSTLYIVKQYLPSDLVNVINNVGFHELENKFGSLFLEDLFAYTNSSDVKEIINTLNQDVIKSMTSGEYISLHSKINISSLSNGERQVYVLCLIWAILKVSNVNIPFIIDTPYARIDTTHRNGLSTLYLPQISKQVIILSTNEEIDEKLYKTIKPYICNEYLLEYDTVARKTLVKNNYFEV